MHGPRAQGFLGLPNAKMNDNFGIQLLGTPLPRTDYLPSRYHPFQSPTEVLIASNTRSLLAQLLNGGNILNTQLTILSQTFQRKELKEKLSIERAQVLIIRIAIDEHDRIESLDHFSAIVTQLARKTKTNQSSNRICLNAKKKKRVKERRDSATTMSKANTTQKKQDCNQNFTTCDWLSVKYKKNTNGQGHWKELNIYNFLFLLFVSIW